MSTCKGCGAEIIWAVTTNGKRIPLDPPKKLYVMLTRLTWGPHKDSMLVEMKDTYMPHHSTCPDVGMFRRQS